MISFPGLGRRQRSVGSFAAVVLVFVIVLAGCSDDGESSAPEDSTPEVSSTTEVVETLPDKQFLEESEELAEQASSAENEFCGLMGVLGELVSGAVGNPTTTDQVRSIVDTTTDLFMSLSAAESVDPSTSKTLVEMADVLSEAANEAGYSVEFIQQQGEDAPLSSPEYVLVLESLVSRAQSECPGFAAGLTE